MDYQKGHGSFRPFYVIDPETGRVVKVDPPADAVAPEAKPGAKAGNDLVDTLNEQFAQERESDLLEILRKIYQMPEE